MDADVARGLSLEHVGRQNIHGAAGSSSHDMFKALLLLYVGTVQGARMAIGMPREFVSFPELRKNHDALGLKTPEGAPLRITGILGRNFMQFTTFSYNGLEGSWDMHIDESVMRPNTPPAPSGKI